MTDAAELREESKVLEEALNLRDENIANALALAADGDEDFDVQLDDLWHLLPKLRIGAADRLNAIEKYKHYCGIRQTEHDFKVSRVGE